MPCCRSPASRNMAKMFFVRGCCTSAILRSKHAHAKVLKIDTSAAEKLAGVRAVITSKDVPHNRFGFTHQDQPLLVDEKVRHFGDAVAAVAAESWEAAQEALRLIKVDYQPLPAVFDPLEAMKPESAKIHGDSNLASHVKIRTGDVEQGWKQSDVIFEERMSTPMVEHAHIEPHAAYAEILPSGELLVMSSLQRPFLVASDMSKILKMPMNNIRIVTTAVGGGFGGKNEITMEPVLALARPQNPQAGQDGIHPRRRIRSLHRAPSLPAQVQVGTEEGRHPGGPGGGDHQR